MSNLIIVSKIHLWNFVKSGVQKISENWQTWMECSEAEICWNYFSLIENFWNDTKYNHTGRHIHTYMYNWLKMTAIQIKRYKTRIFDTNRLDLFLVERKYVSKQNMCTIRYIRIPSKFVYFLLPVKCLGHVFYCFSIFFFTFDMTYSIQISLSTNRFV